MARGGVTEHSVEQARKRIMDRGENPSIDAVRVELGNTGSKTTISRHLKSIEERNQGRAETQESLSEHLKDLVGQLAARLLQDAQDKIDAAEERQMAELSAMQGALKEVTDERDRLREEVLSTSENRETLIEENRQLQSDLSDLKSDCRAKTQRIKDLEERVSDRNREIESLESKHEHVRETLDVYRKEAEKQRATDLEKYEKEVSEATSRAENLEVELRDKTQDLVSSTKEITRLHTELMEARKSLAKADRIHEDERIAHRRTIEELARLEGELIAVRQERDNLKTGQQDYDQQKSRADRLQIQLDTTKDVIQSLRQERGVPTTRRNQ